MKPTIQNFLGTTNVPTNTIRTLMIFGKNSSTYKFALLAALMKQDAKNELKYSDLTHDFLHELYTHYTKCPDQWQGGINVITKSFDQYNISNDWETVLQSGEKIIYKFVFDAFHNVGNSSIKQEHELFKNDLKTKKIFLTENLTSILDNDLLKVKIYNDNQSRWGLVEEAWRNKLSPNILDYQDGEFYSHPFNNNEIELRVNLRSAVNVLLPYQKGKCFYCNKIINTQALKSHHDFADVDHVFPHSFLIKFEIQPLKSNGLWNLVIACQECNRGSNGKFSSPPHKVYFQKLTDRNILFIEEHKHSLRNSILISTHSSNAYELSMKMQKVYDRFNLIVGWKPKNLYP